MGHWNLVKCLCYYKISPVETNIIKPHFFMFHRFCFLVVGVFFFFLTNWRFVAMLHQASLLAPFFWQDLFNLCIYVTFWWFLHYFKLFHYYCICYGDLWLVIFYVSYYVKRIMTHWRLTLAFFNNKVPFN